MDSGPSLATGTTLWSEECNLASLFWDGPVFYGLSKVSELTLSKSFFGRVKIKYKKRPNNSFGITMNINTSFLVRKIQKELESKWKWKF